MKIEDGQLISFGNDLQIKELKNREYGVMGDKADKEAKGRKN